MIIAIDFDDVLFNTKQFRSDLRYTLGRVGVSEKMSDMTYAEIKKGHDQNKIITYDFDNHIEALSHATGIESDAMKSVVYKWLQHASEYFFPDALKFLEEMRFAKAKIYVVSYGTSSFQGKKVEASGVGDYVDECVVGDIDKGVEVKRLLRGWSKEKSWFIEDRTEHIKAVKCMNPQTKTILLKRPGGRYHDDREDNCDFVAKSLDEVRQIIRNTTGRKPRK